MSDVTRRKRPAPVEDEEPSITASSNDKLFRPVDAFRYMAGNLSFLSWSSFTFEEHHGLRGKPNRCPQAGNVVSIPRVGRDQTEETPLFIRQHLVDKLQEVKEAFEDTRLLHAYIAGAPGCGKTSFFWFWAVQKWQEGKRLLFVVQHPKPAIWIFEKNHKLQQLTFPVVDKENVCHVVRQLLKQQTQKFDFCILDDVRKRESLSDNLVSVLMCWTGVRERISKAVFITSLEFNYSLGDVCRCDDFNEGVDISIDPWSESDYIGAVQSPLLQSATSIRQRLLNDWTMLTTTKRTSPMNLNEAINNGVDDDDKRLEEAVKLKFRYAGGCARFMFDRSFQELKMQLDDIMKELKRADWDELASSCQSSEPIILLKQRFLLSYGRGAWRLPVSEYVTHRVYQVCGNQLTTVVTDAAKESRQQVLMNWAWELAAFDKIGNVVAGNQQRPNWPVHWTAVRLHLESSSGGSHNKNQLLVCPQFSVDYNGTEVIGSVQSGSVIKCDIWNQGSFDVAMFFGTTLLTLQITKAKSHLPLRRNDWTDLRTAMLPHGVVVNDIVHVCVGKDDNNAVPFRLAETTTERPNHHGDFRIKVVKSRELRMFSVGASPVCQVDVEDAEVVYEL